MVIEKDGVERKVCDFGHTTDGCNGQACWRDKGVERGVYREGPMRTAHDPAPAPTVTGTIGEADGFWESTVYEEDMGWPEECTHSASCHGAKLVTSTNGESTPLTVRASMTRRGRSRHST